MTKELRDKARALGLDHLCTEPGIPIDEAALFGSSFNPQRDEVEIDVAIGSDHRYRAVLDRRRHR
jgi:hypothetical protein